jgi:phage terminase small subunit
MTWCLSTIIFTWNTSLAAVDELSERHKAFVLEYLKDQNATAAYKRAGYSAKGNSAEAAASRLLSNVKIASAIEEMLAERNQRLRIDADWVLREAEDLYRECRSEGDRSNAKSTLDLIGKHTDIQAWKERIELDVNDPADIMAARISKRDAERKEVH